MIWRHTGCMDFCLKAYKNFGSRVNALHKKLFESRKPQKNSSRVASSEVEMGNRAKKLQDPSATPTEDEFDGR